MPRVNAPWIGLLVAVSGCGPQPQAGAPANPPPPVSATPTEPEPADRTEVDAELPDCERSRCPRRQLGMPNWECSDGRRGGPVCKQLSTGDCGWVVVDCPAASVEESRERDSNVYAKPPPTAVDQPLPAKSCGSLPPVAVLKSWKVFGVYRRSCGGPPNPRFQPPPVIADLGDGTFISESARRGCFRARYKRCRKKCLPPGTQIATPAGDIAVSELREGMPVWTRDARGRRISASIVARSKVAVGADHRVVAIELRDGRSVVVSAGHPDIDGSGVEHLRAGATYDGVEIRSATIRRYREPATFDILPSGPTGIYWAGGIPLGSTLAAD